MIPRPGRRSNRFSHRECRWGPQPLQAPPHPWGSAPRPHRMWQGKAGGQGRERGHGCSHPTPGLGRLVPALLVCSKGKRPSRQGKGPWLRPPRAEARTARFSPIVCNKGRGRSRQRKGADCSRKQWGQDDSSWPHCLRQRRWRSKPGEGGPAATTPRRDQDGPLCSQSAVQGHGSLSFFPIGGRQLPWLLSGKGSRSIFTARERPSPGSLGTGRSPQDCKGPPQPLFRVPALRRAGDGQRAAQTPLQRARLKVPPRSRVACLSSAAIPSQQERPALRPASPTHWASILRWCPPGGRRVPWSPRRWRR